MSYEMNLQSMPLDDLAQKCAQETIHYFKARIHDTSYCFELFRRAVTERSELAWNAIIVQYKPLVARWVNRQADKHPDFPLAREEEQDFVDEAFIRFWHYFTSEKFHNSKGLDGILKYLKMCVNSAVLDILRKVQHVQFEQKPEDDEEDDETSHGETGTTPEDGLQNDEVWNAIKTRLKDEKERTVIYASFFLALSPRDILAEFPGVFRNIEEIYQCKANVLARLQRDSELRDLFK